MTPRAKIATFIITRTAEEFGLTAEELIEENRGIIVDDVRAIAMHLARTITELSTPTLGKVFKRDHSTIVFVTKALRGRLRKKPDAWFARRVARLEATIREEIAASVNPRDILFSAVLPALQREPESA